ncbi:MAG: hypothetical protein PWQ74_984 [Methanobacteriaceae archaeon]|nr:hypothetical protein [Methanobacteriaceae archaeon]
MIRDKTIVYANTKKHVDMGAIYRIKLDFLCEESFKGYS